MYRGDLRLGDTIDIKFTTVNTSGVPTQLAGTPVVSAYIDNSLTQITAGITLSVDFDGVTGLNNVRVVASSGNGFATATNVDLIITTGTVSAASVVGYLVGAFSIEDRSALRPATAGRNIVVDAAGLADANMVKLGPTAAGTAQTARDVGASVLLSNGTGTGQVKLASGYVAMTWADIAAPTTAVALTGTTIATSQVVASVTGATGSVTGLTAANLDAAVSSRATPAQILTTALTESYNTDGAAPTLTQALMLLMQILSEASVASTTMTVKKLNGTTTAATFTLDSATAPTSITRTT